MLAVHQKKKKKLLRLGVVEFLVLCFVDVADQTAYNCSSFFFYFVLLDGLWSVTIGIIPDTIGVSGWDLKLQFKIFFFLSCNFKSQSLSKKKKKKVGLGKKKKN